MIFVPSFNNREAEQTLMEALKLALTDFGSTPIFVAVLLFSDTMVADVVPELRLIQG